MPRNEVRLPKLGMAVTEGTILEWLVAQGDAVEEQQPLVVVALDKAEAELVAPFAGRVTHIAADVDQTVEVGSVLAVIES